MKRYHVISIALIVGFIGGLSVPAHASVISCTNVTADINGAGSVITKPVMVELSNPNKATIITDNVAVDMGAIHQVINDQWKENDPDNVMYRAYVDFGDKEPDSFSELRLIRAKGVKGLTVQYKTHIGGNDVVLVGLDCSIAG